MGDVSTKEATDSRGGTVDGKSPKGGHVRQLLHSLKFSRNAKTSKEPTDEKSVLQERFEQLDEKSFKKLDKESARELLGYSRSCLIDYEIRLNAIRLNDASVTPVELQKLEEDNAALAEKDHKFRKLARQHHGL